jgi:hypothetical protein
VNRATGRKFTWDDSCVERGATVAYHARAHAESIKAVTSILKHARRAVRFSSGRSDSAGPGVKRSSDPSRDEDVSAGLGEVIEPPLNVSTRAGWIPACDLEARIAIGPRPL